MPVTNNTRGAYTSGRYVYQHGFPSDRRWYWQCDLHGEEFDAHPDPEWEGDPSWYAPDGGFTTWQEAFDSAREHALVCNYTNE